MFRCQEFMTPEQQGLVEEFQAQIETEYAFCVREITKINQALAHNASPESDAWHAVDGANLEVHSLQKYWHNRLDCLMSFIAAKDYKLNERLARKYLSGIKITMAL